MHRAPGLPLNANLNGDDWLTTVDYITPGGDGVLQSTPRWDDLIVRGEVDPGPNGVLDTPVAVTDVLVSRLEVVPGPDGILESTAWPNYEVWHAFIAPGRDGICQTGAVAGDAQGLDLPVGGDIRMRHVPTNNPLFARVTLDPIASIDEWALIGQAGNLRIDANAAAGPPIREPSPAEDEEHRALARTADVRLTGAASVSFRQGRRATVSYRVENAGLDPSYLTSLVLDLPAGLTFVGCSAVDGRCAELDGRFGADVGSIPVGGVREVTVDVAVGCDYAATDEFTITASAYSKSRDPDRSNNVASVTVKLGAFLGMEDATRPWVMQHTNGAVLVPTTTSPTSEGATALSFGSGYTAFESPRFATLELGQLGDRLEVDVFVPPGAGWPGDLQLAVDIPDAGLHAAWAGYRSLGDLPRGAWSTVSFSLDAAAQAALAGDHPHARLRFAINHGLSSAPIVFDHVRFAGGLSCQEVDRTTPAVASSSVLTFDQLADWSAQVPLSLDSGQRSEGAASLRFGPASWASVVSRRFSASELQGVTNTLVLDVYVPSLSQDYYWLGGLNAFVECPATGLYRTFLGYRALQILHEENFNQLIFGLPDHVVEQLSGTGRDCQFSFEVSHNAAYATLAFDRGGFVAPGDTQ